MTNDEIELLMQDAYSLCEYSKRTLLFAYLLKANRVEREKVRLAMPYEFDLFVEAWKQDVSQRGVSYDRITL